MRKHLSYANVVATLALLLAMSGGALAAKRYLLNSVSQINPRVVKQLRGEPLTMWALVNSGGGVYASTPGITATAKSKLKNGVYYVNFHKKIEGCAVVATEANLPGQWPGGYTPESADGAAVAWVSHYRPEEPGNESFGGVGFAAGETAEVATDNSSGALAPSAFSIIVAC